MLYPELSINGMTTELDVQLNLQFESERGK